jgi:hypothetical protein
MKKAGNFSRGKPYSLRASTPSDVERKPIDWYILFYRIDLICNDEGGELWVVQEL